MSATALQANADSTTAVATALLDFQPQVDEATGRDVAALASELFTTSSTLLELRGALTNPQYARRRGLVEEDKYVALKSLEYTLRDAKRLLKGVREPGPLPRIAGPAGSRAERRERHRIVWREFCDYFRAESNNSLQSRILYYRKFLKDCTQHLKGYVPNASDVP